MGYQDNVFINICMLFSVLLLHWNCIGDLRNGLYMMKFAICCPDKFSQPVTCFLLGFVQTSTIFILEYCNLLKNVQQKTPIGIISKFAGFAAVQAVPKLLISSLEQFEVQKTVGKLKLERSRKRITQFGTDDQKIVLGGLWNFVYCTFKWYFISVHYYFFPFLVIFIPLFKLAYLYKLD